MSKKWSVYKILECDEDRYSKLKLKRNAFGYYYPELK